MVKFATKEWLEKYSQQLNENRNYEEAASWWEGAFFFIVKDLPGEPPDKEIVMYLDLWHGKCRESAILPNRKAKKVPYIYEGPYENWKSILLAELDPIKALLTRKMFLTGDMAMVMRATRAAKELVRTVQMIDTELW